MIKFAVHNRFTGKTQFTAEINCAENEDKSIKLALAVKWAIENKADLRETDLRSANLRSANLRETDLRSADLRETDLRNADLRYADLWRTDMRYLKTDKYECYIQKEHLRIGCEYRAWEDWENFNDKQISEMDEGALEWWNIWKPILIEIRKTI